MNRIVKFIFLDILKNKIVLVYTLLLACLSWLVFGLEDNNTKGILTLLDVILLTVPLVSVLFSTIYIYNSAEFIELLLSQPIHRTRIWCSLFLGLVCSMMAAFFLGAGIPLLLYAPGNLGIIMLLIGFFISAVFVSIAFLSAIFTRDKAKGIGIAIMLWLFFALLFDGLVLFIVYQFGDYPIEKMMVAITAFNPIDLSRILILLQLDVSAMMGYTGAVFKDFFGNATGTLIAGSVLFLWVILPFLWSLRMFKRKDL